MKTLWLDRETFCTLDLTVVGTYRYAEQAEDLLVSYAIDDGAPRVWDVTAEDCHDELWQAMQDAEEVIAHNAAFDKAIHNGSKQLWLPHIELTRWRCSMAQALSHALPGKLADLCRVLRVPADLAKDKEGKKLIQLFTRPQPANRKVQRATRITHPAEWEKFKSYAASDITAMRECVRRMPIWNWDASAIAEWHCDQRINERGFQVDRELTRAGAQAAIVEKERIGVRFRELTRGVVDRPSQRDQFKAFVANEFGVQLDDTTKDTFTHMLKDPSLDSRLAELMELSMAANKTSTAKYAALDPAVQADGRFRGGLQFAGASRTRRWAGRLFQPQNLPSRGLPKPDEVERYIACLKAGTHDLFFENLMLFGAASLRGCVIAKPGHKLAVADLSNIEGRVLAWLAGEQWKLKAFSEYDAGTGPDLYNITAVSIIGGDPWKVSKVDRNVFGKVPDLASGYQGGVAGYQTFAHAYGVRMADYWPTIQKQIAPEFVAKAKANLKKWGHPQLDSLEISELEWVASETCKLAWRARHPATVKFWYALQEAAVNAIKHWGQVFPVGKFVKVRCVTHRGQRWLVVLLPSGRLITYFDPHLYDTGDRKPTLAYWGEAAEEGKTTRQWVRVFTHGGKMTGNCLAKSAKILTSEGAKPITEVRKGDLVWDGVAWVATDGVIAQGRKAVGTWLNLEITQDHLIHDGNSWKPVMQLDECSTRAALASAASSVRSPSFAVTPATAALQTVCAPAGVPEPSACGNCGGGRVCSADGAPKRSCENSAATQPVACKTVNSGLCGANGTSTCCADATTHGVTPSQTTGGAASVSATRGAGIEKPSSPTCKRCPDGTNAAWTSTARKTNAGTSLETSGSSPDASTPTTSEATGVCSIGAASSPWPNSGVSTAPSGAARMPWPTTSTKGAAPSGLWQSTTRVEEVFDLLNCGPNNRFTVLTDAGPVIVHNCCQTTARDILMPSLLVAEDRGYLPILSVHDEALTEVPDTPEFDAQGLVAILSTNPAWATGLPLSAAGFTTPRYFKD